LPAAPLAGDTEQPETLIAVISSAPPDTESTDAVKSVFAAFCTVTVNVLDSPPATAAAAAGDMEM